MYFQEIAVPLLKNEACPSYDHSKLVHTSKIRPNLEIINGCNSETIQVQGLKFHANSSHRVRYVLTKFRQNLWRVSILRVDLIWNDPSTSARARWSRKAASSSLVSGFYRALNAQSSADVESPSTSATRMTRLNLRLPTYYTAGDELPSDCFLVERVICTRRQSIYHRKWLFSAARC